MILFFGGNYVIKEGNFLFYGWLIFIMDLQGRVYIDLKRLTEYSLIVSRQIKTLVLNREEYTVLVV